jgi:ABC-type glycerol-3-phosphate transport system permease component
MRRRRSRSARKTVFVVLTTVPFLFPFAFLVATAFKSTREFTLDPTGLPTSVSTLSFRTAWSTASLGAAMVHSLIAVSVAVVATVFASATAAWWFFRYRQRAASALRAVLIGTMVLPAPVFVIPLYVLVSQWSLANNLVVLGFVYAAVNSSFGLYLVYTYYKRGIPREVLEAAEVDGASSTRQFISIVVPLARPILATLAVLTFVWSWGDLLLSVVLIENPALRTVVPATAVFANRYNAQIPVSAAAVVIGLVPMLLVFAMGQRFLKLGILSGIGK